MSDVISSLKRLERAGSENSKATEKLIAAAGAVAYTIAEMIPAACFGADDFSANCYSDNCFVLARANTLDLIVDAENWRTGVRKVYLGQMDHTVDADRDHALQFAAQIAEGLLDELAECLEAMGQASEKATEMLETAKAQLGQ